MQAARKHKSWAVIVALFVLLGLAALAGVAGCGGEYEAVTTTYGRGENAPTTAGAMTSTTWAAATDTTAAPVQFSDDDGASEPQSGVVDQALATTALEAVSSQKVISDAQLEVEVEKGKFQTVFDQAMLLTKRYGGYLLSATAYASGEEDSLKSGTVAVRIPSSSFTEALSDASKLGTLKSESLSTQDVTEEYVDLEARIRNSEANVEHLFALLDMAKTIDEIVHVRSIITSAQEELETLKGRMRYLQEHTSFSTISVTIYETGVEEEVTPVVEEKESWGVVDALEAGLRNLVKAFNAIVRALGILIPILILVGIVAYIVYRIVRGAQRRNREQEQARRQFGPASSWRPPVQGETRVPAGQPVGAGQPAPGGQAMNPDVVYQQQTVPPAGASAEAGSDDQVQGS
jgi:hypothetical protein